jgi:hypothetical protein|nr:hypothetical protein [Stenotrophomonas pavanii]
MNQTHTVIADLVPYTKDALSTWSGVIGVLLTLRGATSLTIAATLLSLPWTHSPSRSIAGSAMTIGAVLTLLMSWQLSPFMLAISVPPALYGVAQGGYWATSRGRDLVWFIPIMDGHSRADLLHGVCWFWTGVSIVGLGFHFAYLMNPTGVGLATLRYGVLELVYLVAWIAALLVGYGVAVHSMAALARGFRGVTRVLQTSSKNFART